MVLGDELWFCSVPAVTGPLPPGLLVSLRQVVLPHLIDEETEALRGTPACQGLSDNQGKAWPLRPRVRLLCLRGTGVPA